MYEIRTTEIFDAWFSGLRDRQARSRIAVRIGRLAEGNPGQHRNLANGVAEMKIDCGPGYRVYYVERDGIAYVLLAGGDKSSQQRDIKTALSLAGGI
ncbi:MAG: type II toxin-antitoxin system RelE/ParE family toxin [Zoogloeaceae bacterium]|jgi:putative addiction module killer protein|nr:type II toxin-antitoxin system RelE/ParE family toxin [Zoogloeaceae bacterium]